MPAVNATATPTDTDPSTGTPNPPRNAPRWRTASTTRPSTTSTSTCAANRIVTVVLDPGSPPGTGHGSRGQPAYTSVPAVSTSAAIRTAFATGPAQRAARPRPSLPGH